MAIASSKVAGISVTNGKLYISFLGLGTSTTKNYMSEYSPAGSSPTPTPTTTYKFMQDGADVTNKVKDAIGSGNSMAIKTIQSGGSGTQWGSMESKNINYPNHICKVGDSYLGIDDGDFGATMKAYISSDNGTTWTLKSTISKPSSWLVSGNYLPIEKIVQTANRIILMPSCSWQKNETQSGVTFEGYTNVFIYSTDNGVNWSTGAYPSTATWVSMCYHNGILVISDASGDDNTVYWSDNDGIQWTTAASANLRDIVFSNNKFIGLVDITGGSTQFMTSADGKTWSSPINLPADLIIGATYDMLVGDDQRIFAIQRKIDKHAMINSQKVITSSNGGETWSLFTDLVDPGVASGCPPYAVFNGEFMFCRTNMVDE